MTPATPLPPVEKVGAEAPKEKLQNIAIPDPLHRRIKLVAVLRSVSIRDLVNPKLEELVTAEEAKLKAEGKL